MPKRFSITLVAFTVILVATVIALAGESVYAKTGSTIIGRVVSMSAMDGTLTVKEDGTDREHQLSADQKRLKAAGIQEGYRVEVSKAGDKATRIRVLGVPMKAEPQPHQIIQMVSEQ